jgi:hypothetical protein
LLRRFAGLLLLVITTSGCAINEKGLVVVESYESETAKALHVKAWGIFLSTSPVDRGLTIGYAMKSYIFPKHATINGVLKDFNPKIFDGWQGEGIELKKTNSTDSLSDLGTPIAVVSKQIGVALDFSFYRTGVMIGVKMENAIRLSSDYEGVLFFSVDSVDLNKMRVFLRENILEKEDF